MISLYNKIIIILVKLFIFHFFKIIHFLVGKKKTIEVNGS